MPRFAPYALSFLQLCLTASLAYIGWSSFKEFEFESYFTGKHGVIPPSAMFWLSALAVLACVSFLVAFLIALTRWPRMLIGFATLQFLGCLVFLIPGTGIWVLIISAAISAIVAALIGCARLPRKSAAS